jgi:YEATS domain-containing protein 4
MNFYQGKQAVKNKRHRWIVYVRSYDPFDDLTLFIDKIIFTLHPTFSDRFRVLRKPPYEISEYGWGEFEIPIKIFFKGKNPPKPLQLVHKLSLYTANKRAPNPKKPLVSEKYEEIVFENPHPSL